MDHNLLRQIFDDFSNVHALVIGDVMVDAYLYGQVDRISPEAPVPVVSLTSRKNMLGGAANVALNIKALGASPLLFSVIGKDRKSQEFLELMAKENLDTSGILESQERITTTKFRIIGNKNQMLRVDEEITSDLTPAIENLLFENISSVIREKTIQVIVLQDYNKGVLTKSLIEKVTGLAQTRNIPVVVDPKKKNFETYRGVKLFKPNLKELREGLKTNFHASDKTSLIESIALLQENQQLEMVMVTLGDEGLVVRFKEHDQYKVDILAAHLRSISDVSGAGDTVISVAAIGVALGVEPYIMAFIANLAGGIVCEYSGVVPIDKDRLLREVLNIDIGGNV
ncbi:MAG: D-glycero-beta-D-manno-heptose-7-phosphate kinase [Bacteroidales bacterium]|nr:D-glycero-beta-D-manno-heptose-7-phosphate kinase [Bacteroidales bacterium]